MIKEQMIFTDKEQIAERIGTSRIYTVKEFQEMFNISGSYVSKLLREEKIPSFDGKVGRYCFYSEESIQQVKNSGVLSKKML